MLVPSQLTIQEHLLRKLVDDFISIMPLSIFIGMEKFRLPSKHNRVLRALSSWIISYDIILINLALTTEGTESPSMLIY